MCVLVLHHCLCYYCISVYVSTASLPVLLSGVISRDSVKWSKATDAMPVYDVVSHLQDEHQQQKHEYVDL